MAINYDVDQLNFLFHYALKEYLSFVDVLPSYILKLAMLNDKR